VSAGARSRATRIEGVVSTGTPGIGTSVNKAIARNLMSSRSATRSPRYPPRDRSVSANPVSPSCTARAAERPSATSAAIRSWSSGSSAIMASASRTSSAVPPTVAPRSLKSFATSAKAAIARSASSCGFSTVVPAEGSGGGGASRTTWPATAPGLTPMPCRIWDIIAPLVGRSAAVGGCVALQGDPPGLEAGDGDAER
jgi:hypothetical protein